MHKVENKHRDKIVSVHDMLVNRSTRTKYEGCGSFGHFPDDANEYFWKKEKNLK